MASPPLPTSSSSVEGPMWAGPVYAPPWSWLWLPPGLQVYPVSPANRLSACHSTGGRRLNVVCYRNPASVATFRSLAASRVSYHSHGERRRQRHSHVHKISVISIYVIHIQAIVLVVFSTPYCFLSVDIFIYTHPKDPLTDQLVHHIPCLIGYLGSK